MKHPHLELIGLPLLVEERLALLDLFSFPYLNFEASFIDLVITMLSQAIFKIN